MTNSIAEIENAACLFVIGSNTTEAHPLIAHRIFKAKKNVAKLIVVDPRRIQLSLIADIHIRPNFGTDVAFMRGQRSKSSPGTKQCPAGLRHGGLA